MVLSQTSVTKPETSSSFYIKSLRASVIPHRLQTGKNWNVAMDTLSFCTNEEVRCLTSLISHRHQSETEFMLLCMPSRCPQNCHIYHHVNSVSVMTCDGKIMHWVYETEEQNHFISKTFGLPVTFIAFLSLIYERSCEKKPLPSSYVFRDPLFERYSDRKVTMMTKK